MPSTTSNTSGKQWLLIDVGNTHTVAGLHPEVDAKATLSNGSVRPTIQVRFRTDAQATADEYRAHLTQLFAASASHSQLTPTRVIASSVVPSLEPAIRGAFEPAAKVTLISSATARDFDLDLPNPESLGADRLANVAGALVLAKAPFLIVDAGTATTFCLVDARRVYIGGAIVPGLETSWRALTARAAKLSAVPLIRTESSIGRTTETQIQSGVLQGYEALIEGMADRLLRDAGPEFSSRATLFATGGIINLLKLSPRFRIEADLTLMGLLRYGQLT